MQSPLTPFQALLPPFRAVPTTKTPLPSGRLCAKPDRWSKPLGSGVWACTSLGWVLRTRARPAHVGGPHRPDGVDASRLASSRDESFLGGCRRAGAFPRSSPPHAGPQAVEPRLHSGSNRAQPPSYFRTVRPVAPRLDPQRRMRDHGNAGSSISSAGDSDWMGLPRDSWPRFLVWADAAIRLIAGRPSGSD
jgi:hypothetical protein